jgi:hypothetical protein
MAGGLLAPRIVFTIANAVLIGVSLKPLCHMVRATSDAIWERVNSLYKIYFLLRIAHIIDKLEEM